MSKITLITFNNLKGISAEQSLTGKDIFIGPTGIGKTTRLDALTVAILGYLPVLGKRPMDTIQLASNDTMSVSLSTDTGFSVSRLFESNPVSQTVNVFPSFGEKNSTQCENRIFQELGDFPVMWNLGEFMGLSDDKKRAFIFGLAKIEGDSWSKEKILDSMFKSEGGIQRDNLTLDWVDKAFACWKDNQSIQVNLTNMLAFLKEQLSYWKKKKDDGEGATRKMAELKAECVSSEFIADTKRIISEMQESLTKTREQIASDRVKIENATQRSNNINRLMAKLKEFSPDIISTSIEDLTKRLEGQKESRLKIQPELNHSETNLLSLRAKGLEKENVLKRLEQQRDMCPVLKDFKCEMDFSTVKQDIQNELADLVTSIKSEQNKADFLKKKVLEMQELKEKYEGQISDKKSMVLLQQEVEILQKQEVVNEGIVDPDILNAQRIGLESRIAEKKSELEQKEEIKRNLLIVSQLALSRDEAEQNIEAIKKLLEILGPKGIQGKIVVEVVAPVFDKANSLLSQINQEWNLQVRFLNQEKEIFQIGWKKENKWVPFITLSSGQKVIFSAALMVALILTRNPVCKILGIELGECDNVCSKMLIEGLDKIAGQLDNILVCSWHDIEAPEGWKKWEL